MNSSISPLSISNEELMLNRRLSYSTKCSIAYDGISEHDKQRIKKIPKWENQIKEIRSLIEEAFARETAKKIQSISSEEDRIRHRLYRLIDTNED